ncbi:MAG: hypothetical protein JWQ39_2182 [Glaciihabitans sp.]|nr:hypothetical protein [Glaciihabitans sp.]
MLRHPLRLAVAAVAAFALVLSVVSPVAAAVPAASAPTPRAASSLPAAPVPAGVVHPGSALTSTGGVGAGAADVSTKPAPALKFSNPSSLHNGYSATFSAVTKRTTFTTTYANMDGTSTVASSYQPINFQKSDGSWAAISKTVSVAPDGSYSDSSQPLSPSFEATSGGSSQYSVQAGGSTVSFGLAGASSVAAGAASSADLGPFGGASSSAVAYQGVLPGTDLVYQVSNSGVDESLVLAAAPTTGQSWTWHIHAPGLTLSKDGQDNIEFTDTSGAVQLVTPVPAMWDSSGVPGMSESPIVNVPTALLQGPDGDWSLTLSPSASWLASPDRVYPVYVDPSSLTSSATTLNAYESTGAHLTGVTYVGNSRSSSTDTYWRSVEQFPYSSMYGKEITNADLLIQYGGTGTTLQQDGEVYQPWSYSYDSIRNNEASYTITAGTSGYGEANSTALRKLTQGWVDSGNSGNALGIRGAETPGGYTYKSVAATMYYSYEAKPTVTAVQEATNDGTTTSPEGGLVGAVQPTFEVNHTDPAGAGLNYKYIVSTTSNPATDTSPDWSSSLTTSDILTVPAGALAQNTTYHWEVQATDGYGVTVNSPIYSWTTSTLPTLVSGTVPSPADGTIVATTTPTFTVPTATDTNSQPLTYAIRITTGTDGMSGEIIQSANFSTSSGTVTWAPPAGYLQDGGTYTWEEVVNDTYDNWLPHTYQMTVNLRVTNAGPSPTDSAGPVNVNLANGNVAASFTSPLVSTVGGPMGLAFNYNSEAASKAGLLGTYYTDTATPTGTNPNASFTASGVQQVLQRTDTNLNFDWDTAPPADSVPQTGYLAKWTGYLSPALPVTGSLTYEFGFERDDGAALYLNNSLVINDWSLHGGYAAQWGTATSQQLTVSASGAATLNGATVPYPIPITVDYFQASGNGHLIFLSQELGGANPQTVPADWFTKDTSLLPSGWSSSGAIAGAADEYVKADIHEGYITLTDTSGGKHTYRKSKTGSGFTPPAGENGTIALTSGGGLTFTDGAGTNYQFDSAGHVVTLTTPQDGANSAEPVPTYSSAGLLQSLSDPLSLVGATYGRQIQYHYSTAISGGPSACPALSTALLAKFSSPPPGMLCEITYPDRSATNLYYDANGQLAEIGDPGNEYTDFGYTQVNGQYLLNYIRDSLANDWLMADSTHNASGPVATSITYDTSGRATSVTLPAPNAVSDPRPQKTYTYSSTPMGTAAGVSYVDVAGLSVPGGGASDGHARKVTFNAALQTSSGTTASGLTTAEKWNQHDNLQETVDPSGTASITQYDSQDRATATYGPAPAGCFSLGSDGNYALSGTCPITPGHTTTSYDTGLTPVGSTGPGLNVTYYGNPNYASAPVAYGMGLEPDGSINKTYASGVAPVTGVPATNWSMMLTGSITFPSAQTYWLTVTADNSAQLYIDNQPVVATSTAGVAATGVFTVQPNRQTVPIRINYAQLGGPGSLSLSWATSSGGTPVVVPAANLSPGYSLVTSTHSDDSAMGQTGVTDSQVPSSTVATGFTSPWLGQATSTTVDPGGLALSSTAAYETAATGFNRLLGAGKPAGAATATTNTYYGTTETLSAVTCGLAVGTPEYGMLKYSTGPTPASGGAMVTNYVYDVLGRVVGTKSTGDLGWTCTTYDSRGRVTKVDIPATSTAPEDITTSAYSSDGTVTGNPFTTSVTDNNLAGSSGKITTVSDLLGNVQSTTDVWGTVTTNTYETLTERLLSTSAVPSGGTASVTSFTYDLDGKVTTEQLNGQLIADPTYSAATGLLTSVDYPSGSGDAGNGTSLSGLTHNAAGAGTGMTWSFPDGSTVADAVVRSQSGRILQDTLTDGTAVSPTVETSTYSYDAAGRLVHASIPGHELSYGFAASGGCGADAAAGKDGNRTSYTDVHNGGTPTTVAYCYDNADRLTSTTVAGAPAGANPLFATNLSASNLSYDVQGNTTTLADETLTYDASGNNTATTLSDGTEVQYQRDASGTVVSRTSTPPVGAATTIRYSGPFVLDGTGALIQTTVSLPGGATVQIQASGATSWSYPDLHGDNIVQTDGVGVRVGVRATYDPFGQPIDPATGNIGTNAADNAVADTSPGEADQAWAGGAGKLYEHAGDIATIEMGARQYVPALGRFLETDAIAGGNANDYNYPNDPINANDWSGQAGNLIDGSYLLTAVARSNNETGRARAQDHNKVLNYMHQYLRKATAENRREIALAFTKHDASSVIQLGFGFCVIVCLSKALALDDLGKAHWITSVGVGLDIHASFFLGVNSGLKSYMNGASQSFVADAGVGPGVYGEVGAGNGELLPGGGGAGVSWGLGGGFALMQSYTDDAFN